MNTKNLIKKVKKMVRKYRILAFSAFLSVLMLSSINTTFSLAAHTRGTVTEFEIEKDATPIKYGALIPADDMLTGYQIAGSHQSQWNVMNWLGAGQLGGAYDINPSGMDISWQSPWTLETAAGAPYTINSASDNDYIDPWTDVFWLNGSAYNAINETWSPWSVNSFWQLFTLSEGGSLQVPINNTIPTQIDIVMASAGPKIIKYDFLANAPAANLFTSGPFLVSPSGRAIPFDINPVNSPSTTIDWRYIAFVAPEAGTYKLLYIASNLGVGGWVNFNFVTSTISTLTPGTLLYIGDGDECATQQESLDDCWDTTWIKLSGTKGDKYKVDLGVDYGGVGGFVFANTWEPCTNEYRMTAIVAGSTDIYFPVTGDYYVSWIEAQWGALERCSLLATKITPMDWAINSTQLDLRISRDQRVALDFTIATDSFVVLNTTSTGTGGPAINTLGTAKGLLFQDSAQIKCYEVIGPLDTKTVKGRAFDYYYLPAGNYELIIKNNPASDNADGYFQISSDWVEWANQTVPINTMPSDKFDRPQTVAKTLNKIGLTFESTDEYPTLKKAQWVDINITSTGMYMLNTTAYASYMSIAEVSPTHYYTYNNTDTKFYKFGFPNQPAWSTDGDAMGSDMFYIGSPCKFTGLQINLTTPGTGGAIQVQTWDGTSWNAGENIILGVDGTGGLLNDGIIEFDTTNWEWENWVRGSGPIDFPITDEANYYWCRIDPDHTPGTIPILENVKILNTTCEGLVNIKMVKDSEYEFCTWYEELASGNNVLDITNKMTVSRDEDLNIAGNLLTQNSTRNWFLDDGTGSQPHIIGLEEGEYKMLVIPEQWCCDPTLFFAIENYYPHSLVGVVNVSGSRPFAFPWQISDVDLGGAGGWKYNFTKYRDSALPWMTEYGLNATKYQWDGGDGYLVINVVGGIPFGWTQLILGISNLTSYDLYLLQDLLWIDNNGPNMEIAKINTIPQTANVTYEFGVFNSTFSLIIPFRGGNDYTRFYLRLAQYNTTMIYTVPPEVAIPPGIIPGFDVMIMLGVSMVAVVVIAYTMKKKKQRK